MLCKDYGTVVDAELFETCTSIDFEFLRPSWLIKIISTFKVVVFQIILGILIKNDCVFK